MHLTHASSRLARTAGFTILELMIAAMIFAVVLLVITAGVISFTNSYFNGIASSKTQAVARSIMASLVQSIQFGKTVTTGLTNSGQSGVQGLCIDNTLYSYKIGQEVRDTGTNAPLHQDYHGLIVTNGTSACSSATPSVPSTATLPTNSRELLAPRMRLQTLSVTAIGSLYTVHVRVLYGDDDLFTPTIDGTTDWSQTENCTGNAGFQFCAASDLTTYVQQRL